MAKSTELPIRPRPDLKVSRNANGADVVIAGLVESSQGPVVQGLAPRAVKEAEETFGASLAEASSWSAAELKDLTARPYARLPAPAPVLPRPCRTEPASRSPSTWEPAPLSRFVSLPRVPCSVVTRCLSSPRTRMSLRSPR